MSCGPDTVPLGRPTSCTATRTHSTPTSASASSGAVSCSASSVLPGGGRCGVSSCSLGGASTDPVTGAVSTSCAVSYTPAVVGAHTISGSYSGDTTHLSSAGSFVVTERKHTTLTSRNVPPYKAPFGIQTKRTATVTDSTPTSASAPSVTVS